MGEVWLRVAMAIATTPIVPFNPSRYYSELMNIYNYLEKTYTSTFKEHNVTLGTCTCNVLYVHVHMYYNVLFLKIYWRNVWRILEQLPTTCP